MNKIRYLLNRVIKKIKKLINDCFRTGINRKNRKRLKNKELTLISSNCNGCLMLHDLGLRFNSPFVNMFISAEDYIKILQNFQHYMSIEPRCIDNGGLPYPLAALDDVILHCVHYKSEEEIVKKWNDRKARMDMSNCFVMFTERDGCTQKHLEAFDALPFQNKVVFTRCAHEDIASSVYIRGFEQEPCVGNLYRYRGWSGSRYYDDFDYVTWFNLNT